MVSAHYIRILSGIGVLVLYLNTAHAAHAPNAVIIEEMEDDHSDQVVSAAGRSTMIRGNVMRIEYDDYFVKENNGREVRVHTDKNTQVIGQLKQGDRIEAEIDAQDHALWIRSLPE